MNSLQLNTNETIYYQYQPERDELEIRLGPQTGPTRDEPIEEQPLLAISRDVSTGAVVGLRVASVQRMILESLAREIFALARPYLEAAPAVEPAADPAPSQDAEPRGADVEADTLARAEPVAETSEVESAPVEQDASAESAQVEESAAPTRSSRSSRRRAKKAAESAAAESLEASVVAVTETLADPTDEVVKAEPPATSEIVEPVESSPEEAPAKSKRSRRKKSETVEEVTPAAQAEESPEPEPAAKPRRSRRKKGDEPEVAAAAAAAAAEQAGEAAAAITEEPAPKPARRSRRKKSEPVEEAVAVGTTGQEAETVSDTQVPAEEPSKPARRSRRKKQESAAEETTVEAVTEVEPVLVPDAAEGASPVEVAAEYQSEVGAVEPESAAAEAAPAESRSRRRRRGKGKGADAAEQVSSEAPVEPVSEADDAAVEEGESGEADRAVEGTASSEGERSGRKRRRRRKKRGSTPAESGADIVAPPESPRVEAKPHRQPPASERRGARPQGGQGSRASAEESKGRSRREETEAERPSQRPSYKTAPIPGLDAPEAFASMKMNPLLGQAIAAMGFEEPTPIQARAVPVAMQGKDVIGLAQTGTGKTMAFLIPAMHQMLADKNQEHRPRLLIVEPTRELAVQVAEEAEYLATHTDLRISTIYGGVGMKQQIDELRRGADVIVATPGRLLDHLNRNNVKLGSVQTLVLDEADRMLDMGFMPDIRQILARVPRERQTLMFSATMPPEIQSLSMDFQREPEIIEVARQLPPAAIEQAFYPVERHLKTPLLIHLLQNESMTSVLVFTETKSEADVVARKLGEAGIKVAIMHGDRNQRERENALQSLREGSVKVLVATDVAARGLDISDISHVVNYDMPQSVDDYVHRIGRTARGTAAGEAYSFVSSGDRGMVMRIESALDRKLPRREAEGFDYDVPTPSWAKPSPDDIIQSLNSPKNIADRFRRMMKRR